jgi:hypothetical protein
MTLHWFVHVDAPVFWPAKDPVGWCLSHRHTALLRPARAELDAAVMADDSLVLETVLRRCPLNLVTLEAGRLVVQHHGQIGRADVRRLMRHGIHGGKPSRFEIHEIGSGEITVPDSTELQIGHVMPSDWPTAVFQEKWRSRRIDEADDVAELPIPLDGLVEPIPHVDPWTWADLKMFWALSRPLHCPECDRPAMVANQGCVRLDGHRWRLRFIYACVSCRSQYIRDPQQSVWVEPAGDIHQNPPF